MLLKARKEKERSLLVAMWCRSHWQDQPVHILCQGTRPKADLLVQMAPEELNATFAFLKDDVSEAVNAAKRQYSKKSRKAS